MKRGAAKFFPRSQLGPEWRWTWVRPPAEACVFGKSEGQADQGAEPRESQILSA